MTLDPLTQKDNQAILLFLFFEMPRSTIHILKFMLIKSVQMEIDDLCDHCMNFSDYTKYMLPNRILFALSYRVLQMDVSSTLNISSTVLQP